MVTFIQNVFTSLILANLLAVASRFISRIDTLYLFLAFLVGICAWPLVKAFAGKKKAAGAKMSRSFSDAVCSGLGLVSAWANKKQVEMSGKKKEEELKDPKDNDPVKAIHEVEEELRNSDEDPDLDEELDTFSD